MKNFLFTVFVCVCMSGLVATTILRDNSSKVPKWLVGEWEGTGYQPDAGAGWKMTIKSDATNNKMLKVNYPTIPCSGNWTVIETQKDRVVIKEKITEGVQNCVQDETMKVIKIDDRQIVIIHSSRADKIATAYSVLVKK